LFDVDFMVPDNTLPQ